ncbi:MAG: transcriptional regulator, partial [Solirubrobacterales bacterium]|nr:transcriptional regulator [Solirubrobacterales bacterium]
MEGELQRLVGRNVRFHREALGETQEAFAQSLPFHYTYLGSIERGERNLSLRSVERLAGLIGVEPLALFGVTRENSRDDTPHRAPCGDV